jgi:hypothetical protein
MAFREIFVLFFLNTFMTSVYADILLETSSTWEGGEIVYPKGEPEITSVVLRVGEGEVTQFHCHPVPTSATSCKGVWRLNKNLGRRRGSAKGIQWLK